jgi:hypothetical protein
MNNLEQTIQYTLQLEPIDNYLKRAFPYAFAGPRIKTFKPEDPTAYLFPYDFAVMNYDGEIRKIKLYADSSTIMEYLHKSGTWDTEGDFNETK